MEDNQKQNWHHLESRHGIYTVMDCHGSLCVVEWIKASLIMLLSYISESKSKNLNLPSQIQI